MSESLGSKIKQLRIAADLSWGDLAEAAGLQQSQIALIESGEVTPSISTLIKIARRLGVRLGTLLDGTESNSPAITDLKSIKPTVNTSNPAAGNHLDFFSLAGSKSDRNMEPFYISVDYIENERKNYSSHEGEEFIFVLEGSVELYYGMEKYTLGFGESAYYDSIVPHLVTAASKEAKAKILAVTYTPN